MDHESVEDSSGQSSDIEARENRARRARRWFWGLLLGVPVLLLAAAYGVLAWQYNSRSVRITKNYAAELNAPILAVPEEKRAWPHYRRALEMLEPEPKVGGEGFAYEPGELEWSITIEYLRQNAAALGEVRKAAVIKELGYLSDDLNQRAYQSVSDVLHFARLLAADCHLAVAEKDNARAAANICAILRLAAHAKSEPFIAPQLIGFTIEEMGLLVCRNVLANHPDVLTEAELSSIAAELQFGAPGGVIPLDLRGERLQFLIDVQCSFTDDGQGDGVLAPSVVKWADFETFGGTDVLPPWQYVLLPAPLAVRFVATRKETVNRYEDCFAGFNAYLNMPLWQRAAAQNPISAELDAGVSQHWFVYWHISSWRSIEDVAEKLTQQRDATRVAVALLRYQLRHDRWPESLQELVPSFLPTVPPDRFDGQPLRYRVAYGRPLLYSVGTDVNDDGGTPYQGNGETWWAANWPPDPSIDGDWIRWPTMDRRPTVTFIDGLQADDPAAEAEPRKPPEPADEDGPGDDNSIDAAEESAEPCR